MKRNTKIFCAALALVLVFGAIVGGTIAFLMDQTDSVVNTFTVGNVDIDLEETDATKKEGDTFLSNSYKMVPGDKIAKDPKVTVKAGSEACYLFVKIEESENLDTFITYETAEGWNALTGVEGVYYREVTADDADQVFYVLASDNTSVGEDTPYANGYVTVNDNVTKGLMDAIADGSATEPTLSFTAYACQSANVADVSTAWNALNPPAQGD